TSLAATNTASGGLFIEEASALILSGAGTYAVDLGGSNGDIGVVTTDGTLTVLGTVRSTGDSGNMLLRSNESVEATVADLDVRADLISSNGNISLASTDNILVDDLAPAAPTLSTLKLGKTIDLLAADNISMEGLARLLTNNGNIRLESTAGSSTIGIVNAGTGMAGGSISIIAGTAIVDAQLDDAAVATVNLLSYGLRLSAGAGIGADGSVIETQVSTLAASLATGSAFLREADGLSVGTVGPLAVNRVDAAGAFATVSDAAMSGISTTGAFGVTLSSGGNVSVDQALTAGSSGNLRLDVTGTLALNATLGNGSGSISVLAGGTISLSSLGRLVTSGGTIDVASSGGAIDMQDGALAQTDGANIRFQAASGITLALLDARSAA
ncbi:beta strand repeat-containing protein, partial [Massilia glaciei]